MADMVNDSANTVTFDYSDVLSQVWDVKNILIIGILALSFYIFFPQSSKKPEDAGSKTESSVGDRDIYEYLHNVDKNAIIFFGSQTGTAESYATKISNDANARFGFNCLAADTDNFEFESLKRLCEKKREEGEDILVGFIMATYGEGEPTDNAVQLWEYLVADEGGDLDSTSFEGLDYIVFGLGNSTYENYNSVAKRLDERLREYGANRIGPLGLGDDGRGTTEDDFVNWKEQMWTAVREKFQITEREAVYEPAFTVRETSASTVHRGEYTTSSSEYGAKNPYMAPVATSRELFNYPPNAADARNCIYFEFDISNTNLSYASGDHLALFSPNSGKEVGRLLNVLGLDSRAQDAIEISSNGDATTKVPVPTPTTYDALFRFYLEINGPVSRQFVQSLAQLCTDEVAKTYLSAIGADSDLFRKDVTSHMLNIGQLLEKVVSLSPSASQWLHNLPTSIFIENLHPMQPRYYSIASSPLVNPTTPAIASVVESHGEHFKGVATNFLFSVFAAASGSATDAVRELNYSIPPDLKLPVYIRQCLTFKLPADPTRPIIMIGPGTGVAPFRGFVQERAKSPASGQVLLFTGSRSSTLDYLFKDEWAEYGKKLGDKFTVVPAFSRETPGKKVYVQHRLLEYADLVGRLLVKEGAHLYICGDAAAMATDVRNSLSIILNETTGGSGEEYVKTLKAEGRYQEDVW